jgi:hypothetical protein
MSFKLNLASSVRTWSMTCLSFGFCVWKEDFSIARLTSASVILEPSVEGTKPTIGSVVLHNKSARVRFSRIRSIKSAGSAVALAISEGVTGLRFLHDLNRRLFGRNETGLFGPKFGHFLGLLERMNVLGRIGQLQTRQHNPPDNINP